mgnify:CR=1 FL=1
MRESFLSLGLALILVGTTLAFLTEFRIPHTVKEGKILEKRETIFEDEFKIYPGIEVVYFNQFSEGTRLNLNFTEKNMRAIDFRILDDENRKLESLGYEPKDYIMKKERLVSMNILWTPPPNKLIHFIFSNPDDKAIREVFFSLKKVFTERVEEERWVNSPLIPSEYLNFALILILLGIGISSYGTFEILRRKV